MVYYTHDVTPVRQEELWRLRSDLPPDIDVWAMGCCDERGALARLGIDQVRVASYVREDLRVLPYPARLGVTNWETLRNSPDLAIMRFWQDHPDYDYYWFVEYDVRFTGSWSNIFDDLLRTEADLLGAYICSHASFPEWFHWAKFSTPGALVEDEDKVRGFFPFCRLSSRLIGLIDRHCRQGWTGHPECLWPTVARLHSCTIEEIGGHGAYVPESRKGKYYHCSEGSAVFLSTFMSWPNYSHSSRFSSTAQPPDTLWHPVKD